MRYPIDARMPRPHGRGIFVVCHWFPKLRKPLLLLVAAFLSLGQVYTSLPATAQSSFSKTETATLRNSVE